MSLHPPFGVVLEVRPDHAWARRWVTWVMTTCALSLLLTVAGCSGDLPTATAPDDLLASSAVVAQPVIDLHVAATSPSSITVSWTGVDDGRGGAASYRLKYSLPPIEWSVAEVGCDATISDVEVGAAASCTVEGLAPGTAYDFQLMSFRIQNRRWQGAVYSNVATGTTVAAPVEGEPAPVGEVTDLAVAAATQSTLDVTWTQVDDGTGAPAWYRLKVQRPPYSWATAEIGCESTIRGTAVGAPYSCTVEGLEAGADYDLQLMSFRSVNGVWVDARYSNMASGRTSDSQSAPRDAGIWIGASRLRSLPMTGPAWDDLEQKAAEPCGLVDLADQEQNNNVCIMAKALVMARTGQSDYLAPVLAALDQVIAQSTSYAGRALALGRELAAYVIAADVIGLAELDSPRDQSFRTAIRRLLTAPTVEGPANLVDCHERRPNNWGTHCGASRAAVAAYLGDQAELERVAQVFRGWLGDRSSYAGFSYGDLTWQCDPARPVGINPAGCTRDGNDIDGVLPDDQRRAGSYSWPPTRENYVWEGLQGAIAQAVILEQAGYPAFSWEDEALRRAARWLHEQVDYPAEGDDTWQPHVLNHYYGTAFPAPVPARPGKNVGWTDWTHGS